MQLNQQCSNWHFSNLLANNAYSILHFASDNQLLLTNVVVFFSPYSAFAGHSSDFSLFKISPSSNYCGSVSIVALLS